jgi:hypothetical protein
MSLLNNVNIKLKNNQKKKKRISFWNVW